MLRRIARPALLALALALLGAGPGTPCSLAAEPARAPARAPERTTDRTTGADGTFYDLRPHYLGTPEVVAAYDLYKAGDSAAAADALVAALARMPESAPGRLPLRYLTAVVLIDAGRRDAALPHIEAQTAGSPLADRAHQYLARLAKRQGDTAAATEHFEAIRPGAPEYVRACDALGALYAAAGRRDDAVRIQRARVTHATPYARPEALLDLADALAAAGDRDGAREALRTLMREHPDSDAAERAGKRHPKLVKRPTTVRRIVEVVAGANGHNARKLLKKLKEIRRGARGREVRAALDYAEGVAMVQRRKTRDKGLKRLARSWRAARKSELKGWVLLGWGEALIRADDPADATAKLRRLVKDYPEHPAALQGRLRLALLLDDAGDRAEAIAHLERLVERHADASTAPEALWWLAWLRWRNGEHEAARAALDDLGTRFGRDTCDGGASTWGERARYWTARCLDAEGRRDEAVELWAGLAGEAPFTWYAHLAWSRLHDAAPDRAAAVRAAAVRSPRGGAAGDPSASPADLTRLRIRRDPRLDTAVALVRLGLYDAAIDELEARLASGDLSPDGLVLAGALRLRTGDVFRAHRLMRRYGRYGRLPDASSDAYWKLAYPLPFFEVVAEYGREFEVSPFLVMGLMRHESAFRTDVRSYANAVGLMQLLPSTARSIASRLLQIEPPSARDLTNPALNVLISARFLRELDSLFCGNLALAVSAYNAGAGRVKRWLREVAPRGLETDEFLEILPYANTATYTKRVIASYAAYSYLYGDPADPLERARPLPRALPTDFGPYMTRDERLLGPASVPEPAEGDEL